MCVYIYIYIDIAVSLAIINIIAIINTINRKAIHLAAQVYLAEVTERATLMLSINATQYIKNSIFSDYLSENRLSQNSDC